MPGRCAIVMAWLAAGLAPGGLPGSSLARGALLTIPGENLGPGSAVVAITDARGVTHNIAPLYAAGGQFNAVLPCATAAGDARPTVTADGRTSAAPDPFGWWIRTSSSSPGTRRALARPSPSSLPRTVRG